MKTTAMNTLAAEILKLEDKRDELEALKRDTCRRISKEQGDIAKRINEKRAQYRAGAVQSVLPMVD